MIFKKKLADKLREISNEGLEARFTESIEYLRGELVNTADKGYFKYAYYVEDYAEHKCICDFLEEEGFSYHVKHGYGHEFVIEW